MASMNWESRNRRSKLASNRTSASGSRPRTNRAHNPVSDGQTTLILKLYGELCDDGHETAANQVLLGRDSCSRETSEAAIRSRLSRTTLGNAMRLIDALFALKRAAAQDRGESRAARSRSFGRATA